MKKSIIAIALLFISGIAYSQTTVTLQDQCNCEVLKGTAVSSPGATTPSGADAGDIYVNTSTGTIYFWNGISWELTSSDDQQLTGFTLDGISNILTLTLENGGSVNVDLSGLSDTLTDTNTTITSFGIDGTNTNLVITDSDTNTFSVALADLAAVINTDSQTLSTDSSPGNISISGGNAITLNINDADPDPTNELSDVQLTGTTLELTNAAAGATGVDLDATFATDAELAAAADDDISAASFDSPTNTLRIDEGTSFVTADLSDLDDSAGVAANAADIATNTADIATNTADIATNTADIATNTANIATNTADIATNTADIATNTADIATNAADIANHIANDLDTDATNELSDVQLTGTTLELTNAAAGATGVDLDATFATDAELAAAADDDISAASFDSPTNTLRIDEGTSFVTADLSDLDDSAGVAANAAAIATNTADIATNTSGIATNTADIATNASNIATNTADIATNTADIATNTADIATNTADISTNAAGIANHIANDLDTDATNELSDVQLTGTTLELTNAAAGATGVDLDATFATDAELAAAADDDISAASFDSPTNTLRIDEGTSFVTADLSDLDDSAGVAANAADIATNTADIATNTADIATNTADIATNTADIATNTADIATNTANIATNTTDIGTNATDIANHIANDLDTDATNELSDVQLTGTTLELTNAAAGATGVDLDATFATDAELAAAADDDISAASFDSPTNTLRIDEGTSFVTADLSALDDSAGVAANAADIATNTADIATNTTDIATNTADIATNTTDIATNATDIANHIANDLDTDATNELSDVQLTGTTLELTNAAAGATGVDLDATFATDAELAAAADDDVSVTNTVAGNRIATISEAGIASVDINETVTSLSQNTTTGVISYADEDGGPAQTANVVSTDASNELTVGADGGASFAMADIDVDGDGASETTVDEAMTDITKITATAGRIFYPPSIAIDASTNGTGFTVNLYTQYTAQYGSPTVASSGAPATVPIYAASDLYYYVTYADPTVFDNMSISATGVLTYDIIGQPADYNALINVVFVVK
ncbi:beta strand repeat-containing protein [Flagellimonas meishanensis]|uniref:beta strand repeat-containing protein n=1 Tax=Flagellimonas meishanensis TaxID=2873264 RepID=UPI001CA6F88A|nr:hypothetical protein [[Muricauda] meishanensis]